MSRECDVYVDRSVFSELSMNWELCCRDLFIDSNLQVRPWADVHPVVREVTGARRDEELPEEMRYLYATADQVRRRLHLQGYTPANVRELWEREHPRHVERMRRLEREFNYPHFSEQIPELEGLTFETWIAEQQPERQSNQNHFSGVLAINLIDPIASLALHIDVHKPDVVWIDLTDLYHDDFDPALTVRQNLDRVDEEFDTVEVTGNTLVLTEGVSDARILEAAIGAMYPEFTDMFDFVDFDEFKVEGSVSALARLVKALAGVRMQQRIVALFDNDAAGREAKATLDNVRLPPSIRTMLLPDVALARDYPTLGPEGLRVMDVNGSACSIEMFLGKEALNDNDGKLRPLRWTGWNPRAQRYQGEFDAKSDMQSAFLRLMKTGDPDQLRARFADMDMLLHAIFEAFNKP